MFISLVKQIYYQLNIIYTILNDNALPLSIFVILAFCDYWLISIYRSFLAFVYSPIIQQQLDIFKDTVWNSYRGRTQKDKGLPCGIPEHICNSLEKHGEENCSYYLSDAQLLEVSNLSGVFRANDDYLPTEIREQCEHLIPNNTKVKPCDAARAFIFLRENSNKIN